MFLHPPYSWLARMAYVLNDVENELNFHGDPCYMICISLPENVTCDITDEDLEYGDGGIKNTKTKSMVQVKLLSGDPDIGDKNKEPNIKPPKEKQRTTAPMQKQTKRDIGPGFPPCQHQNIRGCSQCFISETVSKMCCPST